jgi:hypothetical protein
MARMQLSAADRQRLREELAPLHSSLTIQRQAEAAALADASRLRTSKALEDYTAVVNRRTELTMETYERLLERLSPEGAKKLVAQIGVVKSQMKAIGRPQ